MWEGGLRRGGVVVINVRMKVYLDNNILIDIEMGRYPLHAFESLPDMEYCFSDAHMNELLEAKAIAKVSQEGRLKLIDSLCGDSYIVTGVLNPPEFLTKDPKEAYVLADSPLRGFINSKASELDCVLEKIRQDLGFDSRFFNNENPEDVLRILDIRMSEKLGLGLLPYLTASEAPGGRPLFYTLLNIIDAANYWGDVKTKHSAIARLNDASHAYFAQICDILVTNDRRMREKIKAIYSFLRIGTRVMSVDAFFNHYGESKTKTSDI